MEIEFRIEFFIFNKVTDELLNEAIFIYLYYAIVEI